MILIEFLFKTVCILTLSISLIIIILGSVYVLKIMLKEWYGIDFARKCKDERKKDNEI